MQKGVTYEEMKQYVDFFYERKIQNVLRLVENVQDDCKAMCQANAEQMKALHEKVKMMLDKKFGDDYK